MTFRHLATMTSGYARPEAPGKAWAYNDYAIQLYQKTLFDKVFQGTPETVFHDPHRFGALQLEDGFTFRKSNRRMRASVRDFARIAWFWLNRGNWNGTQILPRAYFDENMRPQVPKDLPVSVPAKTNDYLGDRQLMAGNRIISQIWAGNLWIQLVVQRHGLFAPKNFDLARRPQRDGHVDRRARKLLGDDSQFELRRCRGVR